MVALELELVVVYIDNSIRLKSLEHFDKFHLLLHKHLNNLHNMHLLLKLFQYKHILVLELVSVAELESALESGSASELVSVLDNSMNLSVAVQDNYHYKVNHYLFPNKGYYN